MADAPRRIAGWARSLGSKLTDLRARLAGALVRRQVEAALGRPRPHFYLYDPASDMLIPVTQWSRVEGLMRGDPDAPGFGDCHWYPVLDRLSLKGSIVFDVGSHYGYTSAWFAARASRVFCFEASPQNQGYVAEVLRIRGLANVELIPCAVGERTGDAVLHLKPFAGHHALADIGASPTIDRIKVPMVSLDGFAAQRGIEHIALLKVDVEGYEPEVFRGAGGLLRRRMIGAVIFEYSPAFYLQRGVDPAEPIRVLQDHGYRVEDLAGHAVTEDSARADPQQRDLLAFPAWAQGVNRPRSG
jgi:FkbM family methyltransferase